MITARNLSKSYGDVTAVDGISFSVEKGEIFGFLGPNGAGKTTTMKMIQCVSPRSGGTLRVFDLDPDEYPAELNTPRASATGRGRLSPCRGRHYPAPYLISFPIPER